MKREAQVPDGVWPKAAPYRNPKRALSPTTRSLKEKLLLPTVENHTRLLGKPPSGLAADRGFYSSTNEKKLRKLGVSRISLPQPGKKTKARILYEKQSFFVRLQRWRSAGEATIEHLKRKFGLHRSLFRGDQGTREWVGMGILARNLWKAAALMG